MDDWIPDLYTVCALAAFTVGVIFFVVREIGRWWRGEIDQRVDDDDLTTW